MYRGCVLGSRTTCGAAGDSGEGLRRQLDSQERACCDFPAESLLFCLGGQLQAAIDRLSIQRYAAEGAGPMGMTVTSSVNLN